MLQVYVVELETELERMRSELGAAEAELERTRRQNFSIERRYARACLHKSRGRRLWNCS